MKNNLLLVVFLCATTYLHAQERSLNEVLDEFYECVNSKRDTLTRANKDNLSIIPFSRDGKIYLYIISDEKGTAIISNEKQYTALLGYSEERILTPDTANMPPALKLLLSHHMNMIDSLLKDSPNVFRSRIGKKYKAPIDRSSSSYELGDYLLKKNNVPNMWKQQNNNTNHYPPKNCDKVYNKCCPTFYAADICGHNVVGCSAVALGQIVWYWEWPDYAYIPDTINSLSITSSNLVKRYYDWDNMPSALYDNTETYKVDAVAKLLRDCGYAEGMWYGSSEWSMAGIEKIKDALGNHFLYNFKNVHEYSWINIDSIIREEIDNLRPVLCQAWSSLTSSHSFVIDGYKYTSSGTLYHINFGWGGSYTWWYDLGFHGYDANRTFLTEIYPDCSQREESINTIEDIIVWNNQVVTYYSENDITLNNIYDFVVIKEGGHMIAKAGGSIVLKPGFHAKYGSDVRLSIDYSCIEEERSNVIQSINPNIEELEEANINQIKKSKISEVKLVEDIIYIEKSKQLSYISIYNLSGQCIIRTTQTEINVSQLPEGIYILQAVTADGQVMQDKFIREK